VGPSGSGNSLYTLTTTEAVSGAGSHNVTYSGSGITPVDDQNLTITGSDGNTETVQPTAVGSGNFTAVFTQSHVSGSTVTGFAPNSVAITDPNNGIVTTIGFMQPQPVSVYVIVNAHLLTGGTTATLTAIQTAVQTYLGGLQIGEPVNWTSLIAAAMSVNPNPLQPIVRVETLYLSETSGSFTTTSDLSLLFYQVAQAGTVTVNSV